MKLFAYKTNCDIFHCHMGQHTLIYASIMYVESNTESFDAQMEFLWEKERLAPLIAQTTHFTSELAQTAIGAALNIWKRSEMGRAWKACDTIACKRLKDHLIFSEHSTSATIHSLAMHDVLNKRRFR